MQPQALYQGCRRELLRHKSRFKKLSYHLIEYVFLSLDKKHTEVRNIRQYLMTTLYHAPTTMSNYFDAEVRSAGIL